MSDDDEDEKDARIERAFETLRENLGELAAKLGDLNSLFPATKAFLRQCGKTHVKELTPEEMAQLKAHLEAELAELNGTKPPSN